MDKERLNEFPTSKDTAKMQSPLCLLQWNHLLVSFLAVLCYVNSSWGQFVFDDTEAILHNTDVDTSTNVLQVFKNDFWGTAITSNSSHKSYRPLTTITFRLNFWWVGELQPFGFHVVNIILHVLVSLLYLETCSKICFYSTSAKNCRYRVLAPTIAALLFAVHPVHAESVASIVGRAELMSAICFFLSLLFYMRACREDSTGFSMVGWILGTILFAAFALLFKEQGITVMGVCILYDIVLNSKCNPKSLFKLFFQRRFIVRIFVVSIATLAMFMARLSTGSPVFKPIDNPASFADSFVTKVLSYNYTYALNSWLLLNPWWLCFDWSMGCVPLLESFTDPRMVAVVLFWIAFGTLISYCFLAVEGPLKWLVTISLGMITIPFIPASNIFLKVGFVVAERVLYLPSAGYCMLVALGVVTIMRHFRKLSWCGLICVIVIFTFRSIQRSSQWVTEEDLFISGITVCPQNAKVLYNIGKVRSDKGDVVTGEAAYREAIRLYPEYDQALNNLGNLLKELGNLLEAEELLHRAIQTDQNFPAAWMNLGIVQASLNKLKDAEKSYKTAIRYRKRYPDAYYNLGNMYIDGGKHDKAIEAYESAIALKKDHINAWNNIGLLYENLRMYDKAEEIMRRGISENPNAAQLYSSLGILLGRQNRLEEGEKMLERAVEISPNLGNYHANLGVIYHLKKNYKRAEDSYALALKLDPNLALAKANFDKLTKIKNN